MQLRAQLCTIMKNVRSCARYCAQLMNWFMMHTQLCTIFTASFFLVHHCARIRAQLCTDSCTICVRMNQRTTVRDIVRTQLVCRAAQRDQIPLLTLKWGTRLGERCGRSSWSLETLPPHPGRRAKSNFNGSIVPLAAALTVAYAWPIRLQ